MEGLALRGSEVAVGIGGRHLLLGVGGEESLDQLAGGGIARDDGFFLEGGGALVEAQFGLSLVGVLPVAVEAIFRENRADVAIVVPLRGPGGGAGSEEEEGKEERAGHGHKNAAGSEVLHGDEMGLERENYCGGRR